jgi:drug/metabolite transporter (DMT)-like permease
MLPETILVRSEDLSPHYELICLPLPLNQNMNLSKQLPNWSIALVLIIGVLAVSTSSILIRLANQAAGTGGLGFSLVLAASRLTLSAIIILPAWRKLLQQPVQPGSWLYASAAGLCLAAHFALWITSLSYTSIAASTALVTTNPVWVALLSRFWFGEKLSKLSVAGIAIALFGTIAIALGSSGDTNTGSNQLLGDFLALAGSWAVSLYLLLGREAQRRSRSPTLSLRSSCCPCLSPSTSAILVIRTLYMFASY